MVGYSVAFGEGNAFMGGLGKLFHAGVPEDMQVYNEFHALLDRHHKEACTKNTLRCSECCLRDVCATGKRSY